MSGRPSAAPAAKSYQGTFDGGNSVVHGLRVESAAYAGLFGVIGMSGTVQRLCTAGTITITAAQGNKISSVGAGGIAGYSMGIIFQCFSTVYVTNDRTSYSAVPGASWARASAQAVVDSCGSYGAVAAAGTSTTSAVSRRGPEGSRHPLLHQLRRRHRQPRRGRHRGPADGLRPGAPVRESGRCGRREPRGRRRGLGLRGGLHLRKRAGRDHPERGKLRDVTADGSPALGYGAGGIVGYIDTADDTGLTGPAPCPAPTTPAR